MGLSGGEDWVCIAFQFFRVIFREIRSRNYRQIRPILAKTAGKPPLLEATMFITPAYAQASGGGGDFLISLFPIILMFGIVYFLIIRPQSQRVKRHREMVEALRRGDTVVTSGGIMGKVTKVSDNEATVEIAEGVRVRVVKSTISDVTSKTEPAGATPASGTNDNSSS